MIAKVYWFLGDKTIHTVFSKFPVLLNVAYTFFLFISMFVYFYGCDVYYCIVIPKNRKKKLSIDLLYTFL